MKRNHFIIFEKKKSPIKKILIIVSAIAAVGAALAVAYYFLKDKCKSEILGRVDINGDGEADAIMLDTTGNGEIDTIIINSDLEEEEE
jgi:hypothetical protein